MGQWSLIPGRWEAISKEKIQKARRMFASELLRRVVRRTPVDTGAARQNWLVTLNDESHEFKENSAENAINAGQKIIKQAKGDDTIIIQNNAPYINMLEYGGYPKNPKHNGFNAKGFSKTKDGFSRQAPNGMVGVTMIEANEIFDAVARKVKEGGA
jgi:hypothetical protein